MSVSYTHLDVYKRQKYILFIFIGIFPFVQFEIGADPVSYTHLDVYKRQPYASSPRGTFLLVAPFSLTA